MKKNIQDPRCFMLWQDSILWTKLLQLTWDREQQAGFLATEDKPGLHGGLYLLRCKGTRLEANSKFGYRLVPTIDPAGDSGYRSKDEYKADAKELLDPYREELLSLLKELKK